MGEHTSKVGQRVDRVMVSDAPHERYTADGRPVLTKTDRGNVIDKEVDAFTVTCDACDIPAEYTKKAEPVCPNCGRFCVGDQSNRVPHGRLVRDAKAAGRLDGQ